MSDTASPRALHAHTQRPHAAPVVPRRTVGRTVNLYRVLPTAWLRGICNQPDDYIGTAVVTALHFSYLTDHKVVVLDNGSEYSLFTGDQLHNGQTRFVFAD